ncbi:MAG: hypothetical protein PW786_02060 [Arachidicoccus sp.]|nr:hypothetical protein [Arachidicoccus sp.]
MNNKVLIILGMHRSNTSLTSQWLYRCGLNVGENLLGSSIGNVNGHYEDNDFLKLHEEILVHYNLTKFGLIDCKLPTLRSEDEKRINELIATKNLSNIEWGWKEPRTCLFVDYYYKYIPNAFYLFVFRDYELVVSSLITRIYNRTEKKYDNKKGLSKFIWNNFKKRFRKKKLLRNFSKKFLKVWINYNNHILYHINRLPKEQYQIITQESLSNNSSYIFKIIKEVWGFNSLEYIPFNEIYKKELQSNVLNIKKYIKNKDIIKEADLLQKKILDELL